MSPETIESVVVAILSLITGAGGVHAWNRRKAADKFLKIDDMLLTVGEHEKQCQKRWEERAKVCNLEIREAIREGFAEGAAEIHVRINKLEDEQEKQRERLDRMRDRIKASYGAAHIVGTVEPG
jgi:predicted ribosome quality control (RQC) complex YloA/Tae2 family protein